MAGMGIKTGDNCLVIAGKDKGKTGKVLTVMSEEGRVIIEGVNIVHRHRKPRSAQDKGGIIKKEAAIDISNVQLVCSACKKATRIAHKVDEKGNKDRVCKKCGAIIAGAKRSAKLAKKEAKKEEKVEAKQAAKGAVASEKLAAKSAKPATTKTAAKPAAKPAATAAKETKVATPKKATTAKAK